MHECILKRFIQKLMNEPTVLCSVAALSDITTQTFPQTAQIKRVIRVAETHLHKAVRAYVQIHTQKQF